MGIGALRAIEAALQGRKMQSLPPATVTVMNKPAVPTLEQFLALVKTSGLARQERFFVQFYNLQYDAMKDLALLCDEASLPGKTITTRTLRINGMDEYRAQTADYGGNSITLSFIIDTSWTARKAMEGWMNTCISSRMTGNEVGFYSDYVKDIELHTLVPAGIPGEALLNFSPTNSDFGIKAAAEGIIKNSSNSARGDIGKVAAGIALNKAMSFGKRKIDNVAKIVKSKVTGILGPALNPILEAFRDTETIAFSIKLVDCFPTSIDVMPLSYAGNGVHKMSVTFSYKYWVSSASNVDGELSGAGIAQNAQDALSKFGKKILSWPSDRNLINAIKLEKKGDLYASYKRGHR